MAKPLADEGFAEKVTVHKAVKKVAWARNCQLTVSGYSSLEIAIGRPPDLFDVETSSPEQLSVEPANEDRTTLELRRIARLIRKPDRPLISERMLRGALCPLMVHTRRDTVFLCGIRMILRRSQKAPGSEVLLSQEGAMVLVEIHRAVLRVNQSKVRRGRDPWHDVAIPLKSEEESRRSSHSTVSEIRSLKMPGEMLSLPTVTNTRSVIIHSLQGRATSSRFHLTLQGSLRVHVVRAVHRVNLFWSSKTLQSLIAAAWRTILTAEPDHIVIHPVVPAERSKKTARAFWYFCAEVCRWHDDRGCHVTIMHPFPLGLLVISVQSIPEVAKQHGVCDCRNPGRTVAW